MPLSISGHADTLRPLLNTGLSGKWWWPSFEAAILDKGLPPPAPRRAEMGLLRAYADKPVEDDATLTDAAARDRSFDGPHGPVTATVVT
ncbi:MAG: hypothetical protein ACU0GG_14355 [Paracoccaceae bacterium]